MTAIGQLLLLLLIKIASVGAIIGEEEDGKIKPELGNIDDTSVKQDQIDFTISTNSSSSGYSRRKIHEINGYLDVVHSNQDTLLDMHNNEAFEESRDFIGQLRIKAYKLKSKKYYDKHFQGEQRKPLIPLFVAPPQLKKDTTINSNRFYTQLSCTFQDSQSNNFYSCESSNFTSLQFDQCQINVTYTYTVVNQRNQTTSLNRLIDGSFNDIIDETLVLETGSEISYEVNNTIDICNNIQITQRVVGIATFFDSTMNGNENNGSTQFARASITYQTPSVPFQVEFNQGSTCEINDESSTSCQDFIDSATSISRCTTDIVFNFTFTNIGLACVEVTDIRVSLGPLGETLLSFDDIYSYQQRQLCVGETWTVPDRRSNINLCEYSINAWDIVIEVDELRGQNVTNSRVHEWTPFSKSKLPTSAPFIYPSSSPSVDTCLDCTLTGVVSGASRVKLWGNGKLQLSFQGVCDIIAIDNPYLQVQIRTRPGKNPPAWSGVVQVGLKWKATDTILFLFDGSDRMVINNLASHTKEVQYSVAENTRLPGRMVHKFQFLGFPTDNFIRVEELPYGLHNIDVKGFGRTFGGSSGFVGAWDRWSQEPRVLLRDGTLTGGYDTTSIAISWRVRNNESFLNNPSDVCVSESPCGPGQEIECVEDNDFDRGRSLQLDECGDSCDKILDPLLRLFCKEDVKITGYTFWACQNAYVEPIVNESIPPSCPLDCKGDATTEPFYIQSIQASQTCLWAIRIPEKTAQRCALSEVAVNCCESCCASCTGDAAGLDAFVVPEIGGTEQTCAWAANEDPTLRCSYASVLQMCCATCALAVPSDNPSYLPSKSPTFSPTKALSMLPSRFLSSTPSSSSSSAPTLFDSITPSLLSSAHPSSNPSSPPSGSPSKSPTKSPTQKPTKTPSTLPSSGPTGHPSTPPSNEPSVYPSNLPTAFPSSTPTFHTTCDVQNILGSIIKVVYVNICWRLELYEGGVLSADVTDPTCLESSFTLSGVVSRFESFNGNRAEFGVGDLGWKGYINFKENNSLSAIEVVFQSWDVKKYEFGIDLYVSSCSSLNNIPSVEPSSSSMPSHGPTPELSDNPSRTPSARPTTEASSYPSSLPSKDPSSMPSHGPTPELSKNPSRSPSARPTTETSSYPSSLPSKDPSTQPSGCFVFPTIPVEGIATLTRDQFECGSQHKNLGEFASPQACADAAMQDPSCYLEIMFSDTYNVWGCRCCQVFRLDDVCDLVENAYISHELWDIYQIRNPQVAGFRGPLSPGDTLTSLNSIYSLTYQSNGNLVMYEDEVAVWSTNTAETSAWRAAMQWDGNFVIYDSSQTPLYYTRTHGNPNSRLLVKDDGNIEIVDVIGNVIWDRFDGKRGGFQGTFYPGQKIWSPNNLVYLELRNDGNLALLDGSTLIWASNTDGITPFRAGLQVDGNLVLYDTSSNPIFSTNTHGNPGASLYIRNDGNMEIMDSNGSLIWDIDQKNVYPSLSHSVDVEIDVSSMVIPSDSYERELFEDILITAYENFKPTESSISNIFVEVTEPDESSSPGSIHLTIVTLYSCDNYSCSDEIDETDQTVTQIENLATVAIQGDYDTEIQNLASVSGISMNINIGTSFDVVASDPIFIGGSRVPSSSPSEALSSAPTM